MSLTSFALRLIVAGLTMFNIYPQGTIYFINRLPPEIDAPIFNLDCATPLAGASYFAQLYGAPGANPTGGLLPMGGVTTFREGEGRAGYWNPIIVPVNFPAGEVARVQVRVWDARSSTFEGAVLNNQPFGFSKEMHVVLQAFDPPGSMGAILSGLESFCLVPEPTSLQLAVLGALLLRRKRTRLSLGARSEPIRSDL